MGSLVIQKVNLSVSKKNPTIFLTKRVSSFGKDRVCDSTGTKSQGHDLQRRESCWEMGPFETPKVMGGIHDYIRLKVVLKVVVVSGFSPVNIRKKPMDIESQIRTKWPGRKIAAASLWKKHATFAMDAWPAMKTVSSDKAPLFQLKNSGEHGINIHGGAELSRKCLIYIVKRLERLHL